jgi:hypothetical protein
LKKAFALALVSCCAAPAVLAQQADPQLMTYARDLGWQETTWLGARKARLALGIGLTDTVKENVISTARAREIAQSVGRGAAWKLVSAGEGR